MVAPVVFRVMLPAVIGALLLAVKLAAETTMLPVTTRSSFRVTAPLMVHPALPTLAVLVAVRLFAVTFIAPVALTVDPKITLPPFNDRLPTASGLVLLVVNPPGAEAVRLPETVVPLLRPIAPAIVHAALPALMF